jgi:hypothetical protein
MADDGCSWVNVQCQVGNAVSNVVGDAITNLADKIVEALGKALASLSTFWVGFDTPALTSGGAGSSTPSGPVGFIQGSLAWYVAAAAVFAVLVGGARMAWERRADPGKDLLKAMLTLVLVSGASLAGIGLAVTAADGFSSWIIGRSTDDFGAGLTKIVGVGSLTGNSALGAILIIVLGLGGLLASLLQIVLLVVRGGFLVVLAGVLPLSASFTNTQTGRAWFQKATAWLVAFILYKPAAAIIYATAFQLVGNSPDQDSISGPLTGITLMVLSLVALPALLRFVAPMVGAVAGGGGGGTAAAAGTLATGAIATRAARGGTSGGGAAAGGAGPAGPSGSGSTGGAGPTGSGGPSGGSGGSGPSGGSGSAGRSGGSGATGGTGSAGAAGAGGASAAGGAAAGGGAGAAGAGAGAAGGPPAVAAGAAVAVAQKTAGAARGAANSASGNRSNNDGGGPSGSR